MKKLRPNKVFICFFLPLLILAMALFLRFYKISSNFSFAYDQGRDAFVVQNILKGDLTLIGPTTGISGFFLGPFFYYFITPWYWLGGGNPTVPACFLIVLSVIGILVSSLIVMKKRNYLAFVICFILLSFNFSHIKHSRWLSNPNPILIFGPLYFFLILKLLENNKNQKQNKGFNKKISLVLGLVLGLLLQTELANAVFFIPLTFALFLINKKFRRRLNLPKYLLAFFITLLPLIIFNLRHDLIMLTALKNYLAQPGETIGLWQVFQKRPIDYYNILTFYLFPKTGWLFLLCLGLIIVYLVYKKFWRHELLLILSLWFLIPLVFMLFYTSNKGDIWNYYLISQPIPFLMLLSLFLSESIRSFKIKGAIISFVVLFFYLKANYGEWLILHHQDSWATSLGKMKQVVAYIYQQADNKPFNLDIFVPNLMPTSWEYIFQWYGKKEGLLSLYTKDEQDRFFYILEPAGNNASEQYWRNRWYEERKNSSKIIKQENFCGIDIESRERLD